MLDVTRLLTLDDVAQALGVSRKTVANRVARGDIPAVRPTGRWRVEGAVAYALRAGLSGDHLHHVATLARSHRADPHVGRLVEEYVRRQVRP